MTRDFLPRIVIMTHDPTPMKKRTNLPRRLSHRLKTIAIFFAVISLLLYLPSSVKAVEPVSGHYRSTFGTTIELELRVGFPPPASLIVEQYFPAGLQILSAQPALRKYSSTQGMAKWLLKGVKPGSHHIYLQFDRPVQSSAIRAVIRYRYPLRGYFVEYRITP